MERSDKTAVAEASATKPDEAAEIDRIMKEIEDLEKKMDSPSPEITEIAAAPEPKVVPIRPAPQAEQSDSLAETDAVPVVDAPLMRETTSAPSGSLALKIGGCTDVELEFTRASMTVYLTYNDDGLKITTDQGAEFRIPFKRAA